MLRTALLACLVAAPAGAVPIVIDFDEEMPDGQLVAFTSVECPCVRFAEASGDDLAVGEFPGHGLVLWVGAEGGTLRIDFAAPVVSLTVEFGDAGAQALAFERPALTALMGGAVIGSASTDPVMNGLIDESLTVTGPMDAALFEFEQRGEFRPESPVVGRVIVELATVPEPGAALLLAAAAAGLARSRSRSSSRHQ